MNFISKIERSETEDIYVVMRLLSLWNIMERNKTLLE